jgi:hypothetical protein
MFHNLTPVLFNRQKKTENKNRAFSTTLFFPLPCYSAALLHALIYVLLICVICLNV